MAPEIEPYWNAFWEMRAMFGDELDARDVLGWLDLKGIDSPSAREDYAYFALRLNRARKQERRA